LACVDAQAERGVGLRYVEPSAWADGYRLQVSRSGSLEAERGRDLERSNW